MHSRPPPISHAVFNTMSGTNATLERFAWLGDGMAAAIWKREAVEEFTSYVQPGHHTLSCYLGGGYRIERAGVPGRYGAPQQLCSMPDWHESQWVVRGQVQMLHVYFMPEHFTRRAVVELDREPRELTLADRTYFENPRIMQLCGALVGQSWEAPDQLLRANEITHDALSELLRSQAIVRRDLRLRGGLAPLVRRRLADYIEQHLAQPITLGELAQLACMSEFHLARMFRVSFGMPPSGWVAQRRIERARGLLKAGKLPLQQIAAACGYADLSHFSHRFNKAMGAPPGRYRQTLAG
ncbi:AraC family transcriptional regulator [Massilia antarctica]|uniref:AraC family transcriptional regulator n=1 Tax=Massilia antarctica TaxID=2765360 RepID=UPI0006BB7BF0|nr:AraC family transcriptional regulator [Massilia sp. H27-R4]MCY0915281.1 AraC family transcriptional regulator [Massilia sp. H27-R4]CUI05746.1 Transcriptional regulator, AraC family [Janthinobacterium sp. CG23_2]CUU29532.1 Transcriptional regulator, AraC family [Janthinobacterium sp. CG23_2]